MATSKCVKCGSTSFELVQPSSIAKANYVHNFIQCASCGGVVGVVEAVNTTFLLEKIARKLGISL